MSTKRLVNVSRTWLFTVVIVMAAATAALAVDTSWQHDPATPGDWFTTANWTAGVPGALDTAYIDNGGTALISSDYAQAMLLMLGYYGTGSMTQTGGMVAGSLYLGYEAGSSGTYVLSGGTRSEGQAYVGYSGTGSITHTGGVVSSWVYLGYGTNGIGTYYLDGGNLSTNNLVVGFGGTGRFVHTEGTVHSLEGNEIVLGREPGSSGSYEMHSGMLDCSEGIRVGNAGSGSFVQAGGKVRAPHLYLGYQTSGSGAFELHETGHISVKSLEVGPWGTGTFTQKNGIVWVKDDTWLGRHGGTGTYVIEGGDFSTDRLFIARNGAVDNLFHQSGGAVTVSRYMGIGIDDQNTSGKYILEEGSFSCGGDEYIGWRGTGVFEQTGGTNTTSGRVFIGFDYCSHGTYNISGGVLSADELFIGYKAEGYNGTGVFNQSGGQTTVGYLKVSDISSCTIEGGTFEITGDGGQIDSVLDFAGGNATLKLQSGLLDASSGITGAVSASFEGGPMSLFIYPAGFDPYVDFGSFSSDGLVHEDGTILVVPIDKGFVGRGEFDDHVVNRGTIAASPSRTLNLNNGLMISDDGTVDLGWGHLKVENQSSGMYSGQLASGREYVGYDGTGRFVQSGGTNTAQKEIILGVNTGSDGTYDLLDGELTCDNLIIGYSGLGLFRQYEGKVSVEDYFNLGSRDGGEGTYELNDGQLTVGSRGFVGYGYGKGTFIQKGGMVSFLERLWIAGGSIYPTQGEGGTYIIEGGTLNVGSIRIKYGHKGGVFVIASRQTVINVSKELLFDRKSTFSAVPGSTIHMTGSAFENQSTDSSALSGLKNLRLIFEGGTADLDPFEVAGRDKGGNWEAFHDNFTLGTLQLGGADVGQVQLVDNFDNQPGWEGVEALYVRNLRISAGSQLDLSGKNLYCLDYANLGGVVTGGLVTEVPPIQSINATYLDSGFTPTGGAYDIGELTVSDAADVVVESSAGQTTYEDCLVSMATSLFDDNSTGGLAGGEFRDGQLVIKDSADADMLTGDMIELELHEVIDGAGLLAGQGVFEVTGGSLEEAFLLPLGKIVQITFEIDPADIDDFSVAFTGVSNITLTPVPEPASAGMLLLGAVVLLRRRRKK